MTGNFQVIDNTKPFGQIWNRPNDGSEVWMFTDDKGNDYDIVQTAKDNVELRKLLALAKCPDENCDGEGTCSGIVPGYDCEPDLDVWECRWCFERAMVLHRNDTSAPVDATAEMLIDSNE